MSDDKSIQRIKGQEGEKQEQEQPQHFMGRTEGSGSLKIVAGEGGSEEHHGSMFGKSSHEASINISNLAGSFLFYHDFSSNRILWLGNNIYLVGCKQHFIC